MNPYDDGKGTGTDNDNRGEWAHNDAEARDEVQKSLRDASE